MLYFILAPFAASLICLLVRKQKALEYVTAASSGAAALGALNLVRQALGGGSFEMAGGVLNVDALSAYIIMAIALLSLAASLYSIEYMRNELAGGVVTQGTLRFYYLLFNLFVFTMLLVPVMNNLALLWIAIEATTLVSALLVGIYRRPRSIEAAWKYIILCTVGITFALLGTFLLYYASTGVQELAGGTLNWTVLGGMAARLNPATVRLAFILIMVGYGTKAGLAPVHNWLPDAHSEAPTPISALLSGILLNCAFYGVMRFAVIADKTCGHPFVQGIMVLFGLGSIIIAAVFILIQSNAKRLLAYSSIEHMGIISLSFGIGGFYGLYASLLHILNHAIGKPLMFFVTGRINTTYHSVETGAVRGVLRVLPLTGVLGFAGLMALTGMPPFNLFLSEFLMFRGLADGGHWYIFGVFLLAGMLVFYGFLKGFGGMFYGAPEEAKTERKPKAPARWWPASLVMVSLGAGLLFLGLNIPASLDRIISLSIGVIGRG
ncbi:MAG: hydrogenase 4 subunit F [Nitrospiraceae bacterium]|nr:hydrogenase 4 subunit F [Nitrospiraceae bacterium]